MSICLQGDNSSEWAFLDSKTIGMFYDYQEIRSKGRTIEYAIHSYNDDGSYDDCQNVVTLNTNESIDDYIHKNYGSTREDAIEMENLGIDVVAEDTFRNAILYC